MVSRGPLPYFHRTGSRRRPPEGRRASVSNRKIGSWCLRPVRASGQSVGAWVELWDFRLFRFVYFFTRILEGFFEMLLVLEWLLIDVVGVFKDFVFL